MATRKLQRIENEYSNTLSQLSESNRSFVAETNYFQRNDVKFHTDIVVGRQENFAGFYNEQSSQKDADSPWP